MWLGLISQRQVALVSMSEAGPLETVMQRDPSRRRKGLGYAQPVPLSKLTNEAKFFLSGEAGGGAGELARAAPSTGKETSEVGKALPENPTRSLQMEGTQ